MPRLKVFQELKGSRPGGITFEQWTEIVDKMIVAFELIMEDKMENQEKIEEGLRLFAEWFRGLWW